MSATYLVINVSPRRYMIGFIGADGVAYPVAWSTKMPRRDAVFAVRFLNSVNADVQEQFRASFERFVERGPCYKGAAAHLAWNELMTAAREAAEAAR